MRLHQLRNVNILNKLRNVFSWLAHTFPVESAAHWTNNVIEVLCEMFPAEAVTVTL